MSLPAELETTVHYEGDRWVDGYKKFGPVTINGLPPADPCLYAVMKIKSKRSGVSGYSLLSSNTPGNGKLTIVDSTNYEFMIDDNESLPLSAGEWEWSLATYCTADGSDDPLTLWRGSMSIVKKV